MGKERQVALDRLKNERKFMIHQIKIGKDLLDAAIAEVKYYELRKDDRGYQQGDILFLSEWDGSAYTGRQQQAKVTHVLKEHKGLYKGYVILSIEVLE